MTTPRNTTPLPQAARAPADAHATAALTSLPISEHFYSIQGEGKLTGVPSAFIRVSGCNLRCTWCDTPYASWKPESTKRSLTELLDWVDSTHTRHAVLTGGEPMLFDAIVPLAQQLRARNIHITIETAGTIFRDLPCDLMSISPKLSNSTPAPDDPRDPTGQWHTRHEHRRTNLPALQELIDTYPGRQLKFVIASPADLTEVEELLAALHRWSADDILLMPEGVTPPSAQTRRDLANICIRRGWRYCPRLHIDLFGNTRGT